MVPHSEARRNPGVETRSHQTLKVQNQRNSLVFGQKSEDPFQTKDLNDIRAIVPDNGPSFFQKDSILFFQGEKTPEPSESDSRFRQRKASDAVLVRPAGNCIRTDGIGDGQLYIGTSGKRRRKGGNPSSSPVRIPFPGISRNERTL